MRGLYLTSPSPIDGKIQRQATEKAVRYAKICAWIYNITLASLSLGKQNWTLFGKVDSVRKRGKCLIFTEVKYRTDEGPSETSLLSGHQIRQFGRSTFDFKCA